MCNCKDELQKQLDALDRKTCYLTEYIDAVLAATEELVPGFDRALYARLWQPYNGYDFDTDKELKALAAEIQITPAGEKRSELFEQYKALLEKGRTEIQIEIEPDGSIDGYEKWKPVLGEK